MMLNELLNDYIGGMTQFQDDYFVTTQAGGTIFGQYMQAIREMKTRFDNIRRIYYECEEKLIDLEELEEELKNNNLNRFDKMRKELEMQKGMLFLESQSVILKETKKEFIRFYRQSVYLREMLIKEHGELTEEKKHELDKDMWLFKMKEFAVFDLVSSGIVGRQTYETIISLPPDMKEKIFNDLKNPKGLIEWYESYNMVLIPDDLSHIKIPSFKDIPELGYEPSII